MTTVNKNNTIISKNNITIFGNHNKIYGNDNIIYGNYNTVRGHGNQIIGNNNTYIGTKNKSNGTNNVHSWALIGDEQSYLNKRSAYNQLFTQNNLPQIDKSHQIDKLQLPNPEPNEKIVENENDMCIICMERKIKTIIMDCGHRCLYITCCQQYKIKDQCPICRKEMTHIIKTY